MSTVTNVPFSLWIQRTPRAGLNWRSGRRDLRRILAMPSIILSTTMRAGPHRYCYLCNLIINRKRFFPHLPVRYRRGYGTGNPLLSNKYFKKIRNTRLKQKIGQHILARPKNIQISIQIPDSRCGTVPVPMSMVRYVPTYRGIATKSVNRSSNGIVTVVVIVHRDKIGAHLHII
jgi:hypothetical protein